MATPTVEDAIRVLTDPAGRVHGRARNGMVQMRENATISSLYVLAIESGGPQLSEDDARELARDLIRQGVARLDGRMYPEWVQTATGTRERRQVWMILDPRGRAARRLSACGPRCGPDGRPERPHRAMARFSALPARGREPCPPGRP